MQTTAFYFLLGRNHCSILRIQSLLFFVGDWITSSAPQNALPVFIDEELQERYLLKSKSPTSPIKRKQQHSSAGKKNIQQQY
mmetsp:Transcript_7662/g.11789  ORF Transcript_7662/g.11789 Transcript_7662/m.11789 type:complete len:82 (-) Transcript_7662:211-456(-)